MIVVNVFDMFEIWYLYGVLIGMNERKTNTNAYEIFFPTNSLTRINSKSLYYKITMDQINEIQSANSAEMCYVKYCMHCLVLARILPTQYGYVNLTIGRRKASNKVKMRCVN